MFCIALLIYLAAFAPLCAGYSVLTHEEIIDLLWKQQIRPLLLARFPNSTPEDLKIAHAYAYGGSVVQDIGYYPFGSHVFSDLTHYVRTGDFVQAMLNDAQDLNEYAFALGALSHYVSDINGHPYINLSVGMEYPELAREYGPAVPYDVDHKAHLRTEFGFDVLQVAKGRYAPENYHDFIGFQVSAPLLETGLLRHLRVEADRRDAKGTTCHRNLSSKRQPDNSGDDEGRSTRQGRRAETRNPKFQSGAFSLSLVEG